MNKDNGLLYPTTVWWSDEDECFIALIAEFPGLSGLGDTEEEAIRQVHMAAALMVNLEVTNE